VCAHVCVCVGGEGALNIVHVVVMKNAFMFEKILLSILWVILMTVGDPPRWPRDTPLSTKVGTKFRRHVAVDQSV
jgi:hypothetical protein